MNEFLNSKRESKNFVVLFFYLLIISIPFETIDINFLGGYLSITKIIGIVFILLCASQFNKYFKKPPIEFLFLIIYFSIFTLMGFTLEGFYFSKFLTRFTQMFQLLILYWISYNIFKSDYISFKTLNYLSYVIVFLASLQLMGFGKKFAESKYEARETIFGWNPNDWGAVLAIAFIIVFGFKFHIDYFKSKFKYINYLYLFILALALIRTGSRTAFLSFLVSFFPFLYFLRVKRKKLKNLIIVAFVGIMVFLIFKSSILQEKRWKDTIKYGDMSKREKIYPECIKMILEKPVFGFGPVKNLYILGQRLGQRFLDTHNLFFWILTETGIIGGIPFIIAYIIIGKKAINSRKSIWGILPLSLFLNITFTNMGGTWHYRKLFWVVMAFISAQELKYYQKNGRK